MIEIKFRKTNFDLVKLQHQLLIIFQKRGIWLIGDFIQNKKYQKFSVVFRGYIKG